MPKTFRNENTHTGRRFQCRLASRQCTATNASGQRCRRRVVEGLPTCWQHRRRDSGLRIAASPLGGRGVFATRRIPANRVVAIYDGEILTDAAINGRYGTDAENGHVPYGLKVVQINPAHRDKTVDSACFRSLAGMINSARTQRDMNVNYSARARFNGTIYVRSVRRIDPGDELLAFYGDEYWASAAHSRHSTR
jgi:hypothetical protein